MVDHGKDPSNLRAAVATAMWSRIDRTPPAVQQPLGEALFYSRGHNVGACRGILAGVAGQDRATRELAWAITAFAEGREADVAAGLLDDAWGEEAAWLRRALGR